MIYQQKRDLTITKTFKTKTVFYIHNGKEIFQ